MPDEPGGQGWSSTFSGWTQVPRYVRRGQGRWFLYSVAATLLMGLGVLIWLIFWPQVGFSRMRGLFPLLLFLPHALAMSMVFRFNWRLRRQLRDSDGCLCTNCGHSLCGLGADGRCPECGCDFDIERDRRKWRLIGHYEPSKRI